MLRSKPAQCCGVFLVAAGSFAEDAKTLVECGLKACTPTTADMKAPIVVSASVQSFVADFQAIAQFPRLPPRT